MHVLFVCTGNICRSPTAERLSAVNASRLHLEGFVSSSAGVRAVRGHPIHHDAARVLHELGASSTDFAARQLTPKIASAADLIVTMTLEHRDAVLEIAPRHLRRTFTLTEVARLVTEFGAREVADLDHLRPRLAGAKLPDIADPIGQDAEVFSQMGAQISTLIPTIVELGRLAPR